jgi:hypothetical protein
MATPIRILLQTTIQATEDDWNIERFSLLHDHLGSIKDETGNSLYEVTARNRETNAEGNDAVLSALDTADFDEIWLFAVDTGDGLSVADCQGITRFRQRGGGILATRDHQDLGSSLCALGGVGHAHYFHTKHQDPDESRHVRDDQDTKTISWPNYHSGSNGDYQRVSPVEPVHELLRSSQSSSGVIEYFPAHPHEGGVGAPEGDPNARVIAVGRSKITARSFNLIVAFEGGQDRSGNRLGRALAHSSFHHFADYNWDTDAGCPSFVDEPPGHGMKRNSRALADIQAYVRNAALWLTGERSR